MEPPLPGGRRERSYYRCEEDDPNGFVQVVRPGVCPPPGRSSSSSFPPAAEAAGSDGDGLLLLPSACFLAKEHMFDKVVTPSDVGKLNRLVIPKQHAEKYFPLDAAAGEKGLLLNFEDRAGKGWRFRYSYWNSSQSYVMTKGWSRFVKEKHLDAGDTVSFGRGLDEDGRQRLFIDWKHRPEALPGHPLLHRFPLPLIHDPLLRPFPRSSWHTAAAPPANYFPSVTAYGHLWHGRSSALAGPGFGSGSYLSQLRSGGDQSRAAVQYGFDCGSGARGIPAPMPAAFNSVPAEAGQSGGDDRGKTVRLFGVNLGYSPTSTGGGGATSNGAGSSCSHAPQPAAPPLLPMRLGGSEAVEPQGVVQPPAPSLDLAM